MKAATLSNRPSYKLMKQSDIVSFYHLQMPRWLFCDKKYKALSLESKVAYTFLLNRFQLSKMNGWINTDGEVFIIFTRESLAEETGISYRKAIACFKELLAANLIWEQRIGRGNANHIYLAAVELSERDAEAHSGVPFSPRSAESVCLDNEGNCDRDALYGTSTRFQDLQGTYIKECGNDTSECAKSEHLDLPFPYSINKELSNIDKNNTEKVSQYISAREDCGAQSDNDKILLEKILANSELEVLSENEAHVFRDAITRLFYSESLKTGSAILPKRVIRSHLQRIDGMIILDTREKLRSNIGARIKNSTAYIMATLFNNICEHQSDLMVDSYLNSMNSA